MILVTGATGGVGGALVSRLTQDGHPVRALVRSRESGDDLRGYDCEIAVGDYADAGSLRRALIGVDRVFLADRTGPALAEQEKALVKAVAEVAPHARLVVLASIGVDRAPAEVPAQVQAHQEVVADVRERGLKATVLAPAPFLQDVLTCASEVQTRGVLHTATPDAPVARVDARDVAAVAAHVLTSDGHEGATYTVTGGQALTGAELAAALGEVLGREVRAEALEPDAQRAGLVAAGHPDPDAAVAFDAWLREGGAATPTEEVRKATGHAPRDAAQFFQDHLAAFLPPGP